MSGPTANLGNACACFTEHEIDELKAVAALYNDATGLLMKLVNWASGVAGTALSKLPKSWNEQISEAAGVALRGAYDLAFSTQPDDEADSMLNRALAWAHGERWHQVASAVTGALGGSGGIATTLLDLPVTTTLILRSIQQVAEAHGEDLSQPEVRAQCIAIFGLGGPMKEDDDADIGLFAARLALTGKSVVEMIAAVLPRYGIAVSEKVMTQATPVLGALAGATINPVFTGYYQTMAHVHFRLRKLERDHDPDQVRACFERIVRSRREAEAQVRTASVARTV